MPIRADLSAAERADLSSRAPAWRDPLRIGLVKTLPSPLVVSGFDQRPPAKRGRRIANGIVQATGDGGFVWAAAIASEGAGGLRVQLADLHLPANAGLYFLSLDGEAYGP